MMPARRFACGPGSPVAGVSASAWQALVSALEVQSSKSVSDSGGLGSYDIRPRRLVELGYASGLRPIRIGSRQAYACEFALPWTQSKFLSDPIAQYAALSKSIVQYHRDLMSGALKTPEGVSIAGALAILHRGGTGALTNYPALFEHTRALYESARGAF